jgi:hypothetical protein
MAYIGEFHNGVIIFKDRPQLEEGAIVQVEAAPALAAPPRGSAAALLDALSRTSNSWADSAAEMDDALEYLRQTKWEEVRRRQETPEPGL